MLLGYYISARLLFISMVTDVTLQITVRVIATVL